MKRIFARRRLVIGSLALIVLTLAASIALVMRMNPRVQNPFGRNPMC